MEMASSDGASVEPVNCDVPPSTGRKGKRSLVSDDDLQPTPKKTYNLRNRKPKLSEEEVATRTPLSNRRTGKRLAESDSGFEVTSKKSYYSRKKTSTLSEEEVSKDSQEVKQIVNEEIEDMKGSVEMDTNDFKEFMGDMVFEEQKQNVVGGTEDSKENSKVTITTEETKEELGTQKGMESTDGKNLQNMEEILEMSAKACAMNDEGQMVSIKEEQSVTEEIKDVKESLEVVTNITVEETNEDLRSQKGNVEEPLEISTKASAVNDEGQLVSEEDKQNVGDETQDIIENLKVTITTEETKEELGMQKGTGSTDQEKLQNMEETLEMSAKACAVNDEGQLVSNKEEQSIAEEIDDVKESLEVATNIIVEDTKEELGIQRGNVEEPLEVGTKAPAVNDERQLVSEEEKQNVGEEIEDIRENSNVTISTEETKEELRIHKGTESTGGKNLQNTEETLEVSAEAYAVHEEGQLVSNKEEQSVAEEIEDVKESLEVITNITVEETKEELVSEEEKQNVGEEIEDIRENSNVTISIEETKEELGIHKGTESTGGKKLQNTEETLEMSAEAYDVHEEGQLVSNKEEQSVAEEIEDVKESLEVVTNITVEETKEELVSHKVNKSLDEEAGNRNMILVKCARSFVEKSVVELGSTEVKEYINEETTDMEENSAEVNTEMAAEETKETNNYLSFAPIPKTPVATRSKILFMGNLPYSIDRKTVLSFFEDVGNVVDIRMAKNADGSMKGFCHVTFATAAAAVKALEKNGEIFHNRNVKLDLAENLSNKHILGSTVLVRGLERSQPEEDIRKCLMKHFGDCGSVKNIHVPKDIQAGNSRVAFIRFDDSEAVSKAVKLCGLDLGDSKLFVKEVGRSRFRRKSSNTKRRNSKRQVPSKTNQ